MSLPNFRPYDPPRDTHGLRHDRAGLGGIHDILIFLAIVILFCVFVVRPAIFDHDKTVGSPGVIAMAGGRPVPVALTKASAEDLRQAFSERDNHARWNALFRQGNAFWLTSGTPGRLIATEDDGDAQVVLQDRGHAGQTIWLPSIWFKSR